MEHPVPEAVLEGRVRGAQTAPFLILERPDVRILKSVLTAPVERTVIDHP
jgi:hypothetical protein